MNISSSWLKNLVNYQETPQALANLLSLAGLEVAAITPAAAAFSGVCVGEILSAEPHPNAQKLQVCQVKIAENQEPLQIVCGAANARAGLKVAVAQVGAVLPGVSIQQSHIRGVESRGMLCSTSELGISEKSEGIWELPSTAPLGEDLRRYFDLDDSILTVELTPNRGDCLSMHGVAREVAALTGQTFMPPPIVPIAGQGESLAVALTSPACPRYCGRIIRGVNNQKVSPWWLQERLRRAGLRSLQPIVDITNLVMLELGQPLHAFDLAKIHPEGIVVRQACDGETLSALDGKTLTLTRKDLVIADVEQVLALAGVIGGAASACQPETVDIFLESAFFTPKALAGRARAHGLNTDAAYRFERGVDFAQTRAALEYATALILEVCGGEASAVTEKLHSEFLPIRQGIVLPLAKLNRLLGSTLTLEMVKEKLLALNISILAESTGSLTVLPPSYRFDLQITEDIIEEVARLLGYDQLPVAAQAQALPVVRAEEKRLPAALWRERLHGFGYQEVINYSFIDPSWRPWFAGCAQMPFGQGQPAEESTAEASDKKGILTLANPISADLSEMRPSLLPGLLKNAVYNLNRQQERFAAYESGRVFWVDGQGKIQEQEQLAGIAYGTSQSNHWQQKSLARDFFRLKGEVVSLLALSGSDYQLEKAEVPYLHPGQSLGIWQQGRCLGVFGQLHPRLQKVLDTPMPLWAFSLAATLLQSRPLPQYQALSAYPMIRRDLAFVAPRTQAVGPLLELIIKSGGDLLQKVELFDVYQGAGLGEQEQSLAFALWLQAADRTLTEGDVNDCIAKVCEALQNAYALRLRS
jgi:phenylalanyl-tRNA synthetase beta chain